MRSVSLQVPAAPARRCSVGYLIVKYIVFAVFCLYAVSLTVPFLWMLFNSFKGRGEFIGGNIFGFPQAWTLYNYSYVLGYSIRGTAVWRMFLNSVLLTLAGTAVNVFFSTIAAYCVAKYRFPGRNVIYAVAVVTMIVPIVGTLPAQVRMLETFGMQDSFAGVLFLYSGAFGFNFILLHSAFVNISWNYAEAAQIDGANQAQIMFRVMLPIGMGSVVAVAILQAIAIWNDYSTPYLFMYSTPTLSVGLQELQSAFTSGSEGGNFPGIFTTVVITVLPVLVLFACFQKKIMENTVAGGLKG